MTQFFFIPTLRRSAGRRLRRRRPGDVRHEDAGGGRGSDGERHGVHEQRLHVVGGCQVEWSLVFLVLHGGVGPVSEEK